MILSSSHFRPRRRQRKCGRNCCLCRRNICSNWATPVIAVKDDKGNIKLNQMINTTAAGAVGGAFWGALIGLIFLMPLAGAALGAAGGAVGGALTDLGINDKFMKETAAVIKPGTAALFVLLRKITADKVLEGLKGEGGTVLKTSLDHTKEAALQAALAGVKAAVPAETAA